MGDIAQLVLNARVLDSVVDNPNVALDREKLDRGAKKFEDVASVLISQYDNFDIQYQMVLFLKERFVKHSEHINLKSYGYGSHIKLENMLDNWNDIFEKSNFSKSQINYFIDYIETINVPIVSELEIARVANSLAWENAQLYLDFLANNKPQFTISPTIENSEYRKSLNKFNNFVLSFEGQTQLALDHYTRIHNLVVENLEFNQERYPNTVLPITTEHRELIDSMLNFFTDLRNDYDFSIDQIEKTYDLFTVLFNSIENGDIDIKKKLIITRNYINDAQTFVKESKLDQENDFYQAVLTSANIHHRFAKDILYDFWYSFQEGEIDSDYISNLNDFLIELEKRKDEIIDIHTKYLLRYDHVIQGSFLSPSDFNPSNMIFNKILRSNKSSADKVEQYIKIRKLKTELTDYISIRGTFTYFITDLDDLIDIAHNQNVEFDESTRLFNQVKLIFDAFPEFKIDPEERGTEYKEDPKVFLWNTLHGMLLGPEKNFKLFNNYMTEYMANLLQNSTLSELNFEERIEYTKQFADRIKTLNERGISYDRNSIISHLEVYLGKKEIPPEFRSHELEYKELTTKRQAVTDQAIEAIRETYSERIIFDGEQLEVEFIKDDELDLSHLIYELPHSIILYELATSGNFEYFLPLYQKGIFDTNEEIFDLPENTTKVGFISSGPGTSTEEIEVYKRFVEQNPEITDIYVYSVDNSISMLNEAENSLKLFNIPGVNIHFDQGFINQDLTDISTESELEQKISKGRNREEYHDVFLALNFFGNFGENDKIAVMKNIYSGMRDGDRFIGTLALENDETYYTDKNSQNFARSIFGLGIFELPNNVIELRSEYNPQTHIRDIFLEFNQDYTQKIKDSKGKEYIGHYKEGQRIVIGHSAKGSHDQEMEFFSQFFGENIAGYRNSNVTIEGSHLPLNNLGLGVYAGQKQDLKV
jgi:hypothetical protein